MKTVLIIQTAFIGDVILATSLVETLNQVFNGECSIDMVVRKGNESLVEGHPYVNRTYVWDKKAGKYKKLFGLSKELRKTRYDVVYNLQRFASTGFLTWRTKARVKAGYQKNPFAFSFTRKIAHEIGNGTHEVERNFKLIAEDLNGQLKGPLRPKLYPSVEDKAKVSAIIGEDENFAVLAPASVWYTKQLPVEKWIQLIKRLVQNGKVYLIGAPSDKELIAEIIKEAESDKAVNLAGHLSLLQSAELISRSQRTFVNDSAPLHLASAMNAPVTAFFCSTIPEFGFGPLSSDTVIKEVEETLECRPCGLHGYKSCPKGHFKCGHLIDVTEI